MPNKTGKAKAVSTIKVYLTKLNLKKEDVRLHKELFGGQNVYEVSRFSLNPYFKQV